MAPTEREMRETELLFDGAVRAVVAGPGWRVWRPSDPALPAAHPVPGERCAFANLSLWHQNTRHGKRYAVAEPMCLARDDLVSERVRTKGRWYDCNNHVLLWKAVAGWDGGEADVAPASREPRSGLDGTHWPSDGVVLQVGANIGACTMELLHRTNARIIAFEPSAVNLYYLTRTLRLAAERYPTIARRVVVFPLGAGRTRRKLPLHIQRGNLGNTVIGDVEVNSGFQGATSRPESGTVRLAALMTKTESSLPLSADAQVVPLDDMFPTGLGSTRIITIDAHAVC